MGRVEICIIRSLRRVTLVDSSVMPRPRPPQQLMFLHSATSRNNCRGDLSLENSEVGEMPRCYQLFFLLRAVKVPRQLRHPLSSRTWDDSKPDGRDVLKSTCWNKHCQRDTSCTQSKMFVVGHSWSGSRMPSANSTCIRLSFPASPAEDLSGE